jgi:hypothetical protein
MLKRSSIIDIFFVVVFLATIAEVFSFVLKGLLIGRIVSLADEFFAAGLVVYTCFTRRKYVNKKLLWSMFLFAIAGLMGNIFRKTSIETAVLGLFSTLKPVLVFWCFSQFDFTWDDFYRLMKRFVFFFPLIAISYIADFFFIDFRNFLGIGTCEYRGGFRTLGGIFVKQTTGILWSLVYFIYYQFYSPSKFRNRSYFSIFFILASIKVKDIFALLIGIVITHVKKIKIKYAIVIAPLIILMFFLYSLLLPQHYSYYFEGDPKDTNIARVALVQTSILIGKDYFPLGVGFGQYGSPVSNGWNSLVYQMYDIDKIWGLTGDKDEVNFMYDTFWPMILGETGYLGTFMYILILYFSFGPFLKKFCASTSDKLVLFPSLLFVIFLIESMGKPVFSGPPHSFVLWGIAGIFYSLSKKTFTHDFQQKIL